MKKTCLLFLFLLIPIPLIFAEEEPYRITYTITSFIPQPQRYNLTIEKQEAMVQQAFDAWTNHINAKAIYMKGANPISVFCRIDLYSANTGSGLGSGGGSGPNTSCVANLSSGILVYVPPKPPFDGRVSWNALSIITHEIGHGLGLGHMNCPACVMQYSGATYTVPQKEEISVLQKIWVNAKCTIASCLAVPPVVDGALTNFSTLQKNIIKGDIVNFDYTLSNLGNVQIYQVFIVSDLTDNKTLKFIFIPPILPSQSRSGIVIWNTTLASTGIHTMQAYWSPATGDINPINNKIVLNILVSDSNLPEPEPKDHKIALNDTVSFHDSGEYTAIIKRKF